MRYSAVECSKGHPLVDEGAFLVATSPAGVHSKVCKECSAIRAKKSRIKLLAETPPMTLELIDEIIEANSVVAEGGCWLWTGSVDKAYNTPVYLHGASRRNPLSHRAHVNPDLDEQPTQTAFRHLCGEFLCVNPEHHEVVSSSASKEANREVQARKALPLLPDDFTPCLEPFYEDGALLTVDARVELGLFPEGLRCEVCGVSDEWTFSPEILQVCRHCIAASRSVNRTAGRRRAR